MERQIERDKGGRETKMKRGRHSDKPVLCYLKVTEETISDFQRLVTLKGRIKLDVMAKGSALSRY